MEDFLAFLGKGINVGAIYALVAVGFTMVYGVLRLLNFAHSEVFSTGAFAGMFAYQAVIPMALGPLGSSVALLASLTAGALASAGAAVIIERVAYRPLRGGPTLPTLVTTIAVSIFLQQLGLRTLGAKSMAYPVLTIVEPSTLTLSALIVCSGALLYFVFRTQYGTRIRALAEDSALAKLSGIRSTPLILLTFAIGGLIAGVGGVAYGFHAGRIHPEMGFSLAIKAFMMAVVGTIGDIRGAVAGGIALGLVETLGQVYLPPGYTGFRDGLAFLFIVLFLAFSPQGLASSAKAIRQRQRVKALLAREGAATGRSQV